MNFVSAWAFAGPLGLAAELEIPGPRSVQIEVASAPEPRHSARNHRKMRNRVDFSLTESRSIALGAQGLDAPRRRSATRASLLRTVDQLGVLQIDAVNVLARAHYLPLFSRHGPYDAKHLDDAAYGSARSLFEYWGHQASLLPVSMQPLFRWRMQRAASLQQIYLGLANFVRARRALRVSASRAGRRRRARCRRARPRRDARRARRRC